MKKFTVRIIFIAFSLATLLSNCNGQQDTGRQKKDTIIAPVSQDKNIAGSFIMETSLKFDSLDLNKFLDSFPAFKVMGDDLHTFYKNRHYSYAWFDKDGLTETAGNLYNHILNISEEGVPDKLPYKVQLTNLMEIGNSGEASAMLDLMLTAQYLEYAKIVWYGVSEKQSQALKWLLPRKKVTFTGLLDSLLAGKNVLIKAPVYRQYFLLRDYLKKYKSIKDSGGWDIIPSSKSGYKVGDSSSAILKIRKYLTQTGDLEQDNQSARFDPSLETAVKKFEKRFGYTEDGIIRATLLGEMNVPVEKRIEQILVNMERSRWLPEQLNTNYLFINIPEFKLYVFENDRIVYDMKVVVGKDQHNTVVFNGDIKYVVFSPYWNIPYSIMKNEILPAMRRNRNYLARHEMEWNGARIRQKPGPNNSLGLVKFLFPNSFNIYLHDTPFKSLFNEDNRAFSHGCIRLEKPRWLAQYLLREDTSWNDIKIDSAMHLHEEEFVTLKKTMPVFITYFTAWVDAGGDLNFRRDIYKRDERLVEMIFYKEAD